MQVGALLIVTMAASWELAADSERISLDSHPRSFHGGTERPKNPAVKHASVKMVSVRALWSGP